LRGGVLPRPVLRFRGGTAVSPREGLGLFGPLKGPGRIALAYTGEEGLSGKTGRLVESLLSRVKWYRPMGELLDVDVEAYEVSGGGGLEERLREAASTSPDVVLVGVRDDVPEERDMYVPAKQVLASLGVASQMVAARTLDRLYRNPYVLLNLAVNLYGKAGGIAWGIADDMDRDFYLGLDVGGGVMAAVLLVDPGDPVVEWTVFPVLDVEYSGSVGEALEWAAARAAEITGRRPGSLAVLRDGRMHWGEVEAIRSMLSTLAARGVVEDRSSYVVVEVRKRVTPLLVRRSRSRFTNPEKGAYIALGEEEYIVATTGWPERRVALGTVRPIAVARVDTDNWERDFLRDVREVYWLSALHWGSMFTSPRTPIVTLYAHRIASFFRLGVYPEPGSMGGLWFL